MYLLALSLSNYSKQMCATLFLCVQMLCGMPECRVRDGLGMLLGEE